MFTFILGLIAGCIVQEYLPFSVATIFRNLLKKLGKKLAELTSREQ